jgi:hypothetical protein
MLGCYRLPLAYAVEDLKLSTETLSKGFQQLLRKGFIERDERLGWTLIPNHLKWNTIDNPNQGKAITKLVAAVPKETSVFAGLISALRSYGANLPEGFVDSLETVSEPFRNQEQKQISKQHQEQNKSPSESGSLDYNSFVEAWNGSCGPLAKVTKLTAGRRDKLRARVAEGPTVESFGSTANFCASTPFLRGDNPRKWRASFDWVIENDSNLVAVTEGKYGSPHIAGSATVGYLVGDAYSSPDYELDETGGIR